MSLSKTIKEYNIAVEDTINYNISECSKRGILPEYVKICKKILKDKKLKYFK